MKKNLLLLLLCTALPLHAAESWLLKLERWGNPSYMTLHLQDDKGRLSGTLDGDSLSGTVEWTPTLYRRIDPTWLVPIPVLIGAGPSR